MQQCQNLSGVNKLLKFSHSSNISLGGLCNRYSKKFKIYHSSKRYDPMSYSEGVIHPTESENLLAIRNHLGSAQHQGVVKRLQSMTLSEISEDDFDFTSGQYESDIYEVTVVSTYLFYNISISKVIEMYLLKVN